MTKVISQGALNRALLARQLLLERADQPPLKAVAQVLGLQAQVQNPPYIGLWTRLKDFERDDLTRAMEERKIVRAVLMRSTLHLMTATDFCQFATVMRPAQIRAFKAFHGKYSDGLDVAGLVKAVTAEFGKGPRTFPEAQPALAQVEPERPAETLRYASRTYVPLVQVPPTGVWGKGGSTIYALAESYLEREINSDNDVRPLFLRYLAAFGPASVKDFQAWSGLTGQQKAIDGVRDDLITFNNEQGVELFDLPDAPLPDADQAAPVRFLPEYDNAILGHADRSRIVADEYRKRVYLTAGRVRSVFLVDGFTAGAWKVEKGKGKATLVIEPFAPLGAQDKKEVLAEGEQLLRWIEASAKEYDLRIEK